MSKAEPKCGDVEGNKGNSKKVSKKLESLVIKEGNNIFKWSKEVGILITVKKCTRNWRQFQCNNLLNFFKSFLSPFLNSRIMLIGFPLLLLLHNTTESMTNPKTIDWKPLGKDRHPDLAYLESLLKLPGTEVQIGQRFEVTEAKPSQLPKSLPPKKPLTATTTSLQTLPKSRKAPPLIGEMKIKMDRALKLSKFFHENTYCSLALNISI